MPRLITAEMIEGPTRDKLFDLAKQGYDVMNLQSYTPEALEQVLQLIPAGHRSMIQIAEERRRNGKTFRHVQRLLEKLPLAARVEALKTYCNRCGELKAHCRCFS